MILEAISDWRLAMRIHFYRNCTMKLEYGGKVFLVDPMFRARGVTHQLKTTHYPEKPPLTDLPEAQEEIMKGVEAVLLTHVHPGHIDQEAADCIPKDMPFYTQNLNDKDLVRNYGMSKTQTINMTLSTHYEDVDIIRVAGRHGEGMHITMGTEDLEKIQSAAPYAKIVCVHMETFENQELTRDALRAYAMQRGFLDQLIIPENGDTIEFS